MRRALLVSGIAAAALGLGAAAAAAQATPTAQMSAPRTATAGAPVWVRSVDPCPVLAGEYQYVIVGFAPQLLPEGEPAGVLRDSSTADLRPDGSWEVTITAPSTFTDGVTKTFSIQASCEVVPEPYRVEGDDETASTTGGSDQHVSIQRYQIRPLRVTAALGSGAASPDTTTATTVASSRTTTTTTPSSPTTVVASSYEAQAAEEPLVDAEVESATSVAHNPVSADDVRHELLLRQRPPAELELSAAAARDDAPLSAPDGGIPWWAFVLATFLAVGGVIAYGVKRSTA